MTTHISRQTAKNLLDSIARSDPHAIQAAIDAMNGGNPWPHIVAAILEQVPILAVRARTGDIAAYQAVMRIQGSAFASHRQEELYQLILELEAICEPIIIREIQGLLRLALAGNLAAIKAAVDCCFREGYIISGRTIHDILPPEITVTDLMLMVDRYNQEAPAHGLPPLLGQPFQEPDIALPEA